MRRLFSKNAPKVNGRAGVSLDESRVGLARVRRLQGDKPSLSACAIRIEDEDDGWSLRAESRIGKMALREAAASAVLRPDAYHLQLVETPNVPAKASNEAPPSRRGRPQLACSHR